MRVLLAAVVVAMFATTPGAAAPVRGDIDLNGIVAPTDIFYLINYLNTSAVTINTCRADANSDGIVTNVDIAFLAAYVFAGGPEPIDLPETCNGFDDDCNEVIDDPFPNLGSPCSVGIGICERTGTFVCRPDGTGTMCSASPGMPEPFETCNGLDDNCDGGIDEGLSGCFLMSFGQSPWPAQEDSSHDPQVGKVDGYFLLDRSGSMQNEISDIKNSAQASIDAMQCPPNGTGTPGPCIEDLWFGAGTLGYTGANGSPYLNHVDVQPNPSFAAVPTTEPPGCCSGLRTRRVPGQPKTRCKPVREPAQKHSIAGLVLSYWE